MSSPSSTLLATHASCLPTGTVMGDFEIIGLVGEGGFGIVYLARDTTLDRVVALKEFMPAAFAGRVDGVRVAVRSANNLATYEAGLRSFINEAKMLAKFSHPALVEVYRFWEANGTAYMAMKFYSGETLRQQLARGDTSFDEESIAQIMAPVFDAMEMLHREQVYHRDIAPDNIMLTDGRPVLLDFGSARRIIGDGTQALTTVLKPGYAPIEQYVDDGTMKQGPWTDVYALGGVLYHLATGKAPLQAVSRLLTDPLRSVNEVTHEAFSPQFSAAVAKAMAVRVEDRLRNVREFSEMLGWNTAQASRVVTLPKSSQARPVLDSPAEPQPALSAAPDVVSATGTSAPKDEPAPRSEAPTARGKRPMAIIVAGVVAVAGLAGYWYQSASKPSTPALAMAPVPLAPALPAPDAVLSTAATRAVAAGPADASSAAAPKRMGTLKLNINPWGTVVIDGVTRGISNASQLRQIELSVGTHTVEIAKPDAPPVRQTIELGDSPLSISHTFK